MGTFILAAAQTTDDGIYLPEGGASTVVWVIFVALIAGLYWTVSRTRRRAEQEFWERKKNEEREQGGDRPPRS
ncbi:MAG: hypothetical protein V3S62_02705 [Acidimicrobiia bacterium]